MGLWGWTLNSRDVFCAQKNILRSMLDLKYTEFCIQHFMRLDILAQISLFTFVLCVNIFSNNGELHSINTDQQNFSAKGRFDVRKLKEVLIIWALRVFNSLPRSIRALAFPERYWKFIYVKKYFMFYVTETSSSHFHFNFHFHSFSLPVLLSVFRVVLFYYYVNISEFI